MTNRVGAASESAGALRVGIVSLGCAKNLVDTEVMLGHLARAGCRMVRDPEEADAVVVNTCGFIGPAREESIRSILEIARYKRIGRLKRLVVAGCMVQRYAAELRESLPEVDAFLGLDQLDGVLAAVRADPSPARPGTPPARRRGGGTGSTYLYDHRTPRILATPRWTAFLKIAEGCDHTCSFCAIPAFRGSFRSRRPESVVEEAAALSRSGVRELNLVAQDSSQYGADLGMEEALADLLERLDRVEGLRWIRVHYLYPNTVSRRLIETMARLDRVVNYVDLPLQHVHPDVLSRMRRGGSARSHLALLERFRARMPAASLRSTFIVGFPGETEEEFRALLDFLEEARLDHVGAFRYSHEEGTPAWSLGDDVPEKVKQERWERLMEVQQRIAEGKNRERVGRVVETLVEGAHPETEHLLVGRTAGQAPDVDGTVLINDGVAEPGRFVPVEITDVAGYDLVGRITGAA